MIAHYIILHQKRQRVNATVKSLRSNLIYEEDKDIFVDEIKNGKGNECPFVFSMPWIYSYCHAPNLKRAPSLANSYIQPGSYLIFVDYTKKNYLLVDTVIYVNNVLVWPIKASSPPVDYSYRNSSTWFRHIRHGIMPNAQHKGEYTYEAEMYKDNKRNFSFLPLNNGNITSICLNNLDHYLKEKIENNISLRRKPPVSLTNDQLMIILNAIDSNLTDKIIEVIGIKEIMTNNSQKYYKSGNNSCT
jgi:hypothetical protein